jgi:hypothetical protein
MTSYWKYGADRHSYAEAKSPFIWKVMRRTVRWAQDTGWQPAPSDC